MEKVREEKQGVDDRFHLSIMCPRCRKEHEIYLTNLAFPVIVTDEVYFNMFGLCEAVGEPVMAWYSDISREVTIIV